MHNSDSDTQNVRGETLMAALLYQMTRCAATGSPRAGAAQVP